MEPDPSPSVLSPLRFAPRGEEFVVGGALADGPDQIRIVPFRETPFEGERREPPGVRCGNRSRAQFRSVYVAGREDPGPTARTV
jgi:hypothetical protein